MFCVAKRCQTSKRMYFLTCRGVNPSKNTVYDVLRPYGRRMFNRVILLVKNRLTIAMAKNIHFTLAC